MTNWAVDAVARGFRVRHVDDEVITLAAVTTGIDLDQAVAAIVAVATR